MKVILFGATGMVGQGVLRECLLDARVERVLTVGRTVTGQSNAKLREIAHADLFDLSRIEAELTGYDACFFCLGVSAAGMNEADYRRVTYDLTLSVARTLVRLNPAMTFVYVSGAGTNAQGSAMWARVKGETENALLALPWKGAYMFRPAFIQPRHGVTSKTGWYRAIYAVFSPMYPLFKAVAPKFVTETDAVGRAMIEVAARANEKRVVENGEINAIAIRA